MAPHLLDTNIASHIIKGTTPSVDRRLAKMPPANVFISTVTEAELRYGLARLPRATRLEALVEDFLLMVNILPWDSEAAKRYGRLRANLERDGLPMANLDLMIGAHALALGAILVTSDRAFSRIENLKIADWTRA
ncbi:MAG: type II toxin-antitoxin system VapC family toxin [Bryobacteraceae bacterium]